MPPSPEGLKQRNTTFRGDVLRLASGTGIAQLISILSAPILSRLYAPEAFGVAAVFASVTSILGVMACMRYELSIVLPESDRDAANLLAGSLGVSVVYSLLCGMVMLLAGERIADLVNMPQIVPYLWLVPIVVLLHGVFVALNYWNTRTKHFARLSITRVTQQVVGTGLSLGGALAGRATGGMMILASAGGQAVATATLGGQILRDDGRFLRGSLRWPEVLAGLRRHRNFPLFSSWSALLNNVSWQLPALLLSTFFSPAVVGFYALGFRMLQMPMNLVGRAISQVFLQRAAVERAQGNLGELVEALFRRLLIISLVPGLILMVVGSELFSFVFGSNWTEAGVYTQMLAPWVVIWFISSPLSSIYTVLEKQSREPGLQALILFVRFAGLGLGGYLASPRLAIFFFALGGIFAYGYLVRTIFGFCGMSTMAVLVRARTTIFVAVMFVIPVAAAGLLGLSGLPLLALAGATAAAYFLTYRKRLLNPARTI